MDRPAALLEDVQRVGARVGANVLVLVTDRSELARLALEQSSLPVILATGSAELHDDFAKLTRDAILLREPLASSVGVVGQVKDILLGAFFQGKLRADESAVVLLTGGDAVEMVLHYDVGQDVEVVHLQEELETDTDLRVVERVLMLSIELAREGREGKPLGTIFVLGDSDAVLRHTRPAVLNPFAGHPEKDRNIMDDTIWETAKEFAQVDGAFVIRGDGVVEAAGRYIDTSGALDIQAGLGGRHLAAASITSATRAIAIVVSASGTVRVFKGGRVVMMVGRV